MDEIQRVLIKQGRKDLAQKYYKKTMPTRSASSFKVREALDKFLDEFSCEIVLDSLSDVLDTKIHVDYVDDKDKAQGYSMIKKHIDTAKNFATTHSL